jgi:tetratricopeptide (TPR) repeat protein
LGILYNNIALQDAREEQWDHADTSFRLALDHHRVVGNEEGLAVTYSQMGKSYLQRGNLIGAERCLNNASEHYVRLGHEQAEAAVLRLLAAVYEQRRDTLSARRCLERVIMIDRRYHLPDEADDVRRLAQQQP